MIENALGFLVIMLGLSAIALQRLYSAIPSHELKRLAGRGDQLAARLYRAVAYGASLRLLLWIVVGISIPAGLLLVLPGLPPVAGFLLLSLVAIAGFIWLPSLLLTQRTAQAAAIAAPAVSRILLHAHPMLEYLTRLANRFRDIPLHSRLYEKEDLLELLDRQRRQADNRIHEDDLDLVQRALVFSDTLAADLVLPRGSAHLVNADDSIGPVMLDQLHQQRQASFLVYKDAKDNIIGSLALADAVIAKHGGRVFDLIRSDLIYVHEDFTARQVLNAFHKTGHQVAVVVNNAEEFVGVITLDHLLQALLGEAQDEELAYGDRSVVAAYKPESFEARQNSNDQQEKTAAPDAAEAQEDEAKERRPKDASPEATEVIE